LPSASASVPLAIEVAAKLPELPSEIAPVPVAVDELPTAIEPLVPVASAELPSATELLVAVLLLPSATEPVPLAELPLPSVTAPAPLAELLVPSATAPSPLAVCERPIATAPPAAEPAFAVVPVEPIATFWPVAPETTPSPCAMPYAPFVVAPRPIAMPDVAVDVTDDWPPIEIESCAAACAPAVELLPIAVEPVPDATVGVPLTALVLPKAVA
jgi:hypothetical protein